MEESCPIPTPSFNCIKKNETTEVVSYKSNFEGAPHIMNPWSFFFIGYVFSQPLFFLMHPSHLMKRIYSIFTNAFRSF